MVALPVGTVDRELRERPLICANFSSTLRQRAIGAPALEKLRARQLHMPVKLIDPFGKYRPQDGGAGCSHPIQTKV